MKSVVAIKKKKPDTFWKTFANKTRKEVKRKKLGVVFYAFVPALRPRGILLAPIRIYKTAVERWIEEEMKYASIQFFFDRMGLFRINRFDAEEADGKNHWSYWLTPWPATQKEIEDSNWWYSQVKDQQKYWFGHGPEVGYERVFRDFILPVAAAYVLNGRLKSRLRKFHSDYYGWLAAIRQDFVGGEEFWMTVEKKLEEWLWENKVNDVNAFWNEYGKAKSGAIINVFHLCLERFATDLWYLIDHLEDLFERPQKSLETRIEKTAWEGMVVEWVEQQEDEELYIQLYETEGALAWYRDFVVPERKIEHERLWDPERVCCMLRERGMTMPTWHGDVLCW